VQKRGEDGAGGDGDSLQVIPTLKSDDNFTARERHQLACEVSVTRRSDVLLPERVAFRGVKPA
jgi:hypothetical protein